VGGADAAAKMAILASIAFHTRVPPRRRAVRGHRPADLADVTYAGELGYRVKLLGTAHARTAASSSASSRRSCRTGIPWRGVEGSFNAVMLRGDAIREITLVGPGAGGDETASAVIGDVMGLLGTSGTGFFQHDGYFRPPARARPCEAVTALYLRFDVVDQPGVLARVSGVLAEHGVSIESVVQRAEGGRARLIILTHPAPEGRSLAAGGAHRGARRLRLATAGPPHRPDLTAAAAPGFGTRTPCRPDGPAPDACLPPGRQPGPSAMLTRTRSTDPPVVAADRSRDETRRAPS
jgi:homoserine dehydrogenase